MQCRERLETFLREHKVPFQTQHHTEAFTAQEIAASEHVPGNMLAKVVVVATDGRRWLLALPAPRMVDLAKAAAVVGEQEVRLATEAELAELFSDCDVGAMPPFGNLYDLPTYVDETLSGNETIVFNAGTHTDTMSLKYADFERVVKPGVADFAVER